MCIYIMYLSSSLYWGSFAQFARLQLAHQLWAILLQVHPACVDGTVEADGVGWQRTRPGRPRSSFSRYAQGHGIPKNLLRNISLGYLDIKYMLKRQFYNYFYMDYKGTRRACVQPSWIFQRVEYSGPTPKWPVGHSSPMISLSVGGSLL